MKDSLILQDKNYISARRVNELFGYTTDYVGQLCRAGKLDCKMIGRSWFVTEKSIIEYQSQVNELLKNKTKEKRKNAKKFYTQRAALLAAYSQARAQVEVRNSDVVKNEVVGNLENEKKEEVKLEVRVEAEAQVLSPIQQEGVAHSDTNYTQVAFSKVDNYPVVLVPKTFALPYYVNQSFLIAPFYSKKESLISSPSFINFSLATGVFVIAFMFFFQSVFPVLYPSSTVLQKIPDTSTASVMTASQEVFASVFSFVTKLPELAVNTFGNIFNKKSNLAVNEDVKNDVNDNTSNSIVENNIDQNNSSDDVEFNGMAVTPSTGSAEKDEALKQKIRASFSDEVAVTPDNSGTAGVITPVFKKSTGDDFLYVLVPVNDIN